MVKSLNITQEAGVQILKSEDPSQTMKMATHSSISIGEFHGQSLAPESRGCKESDMTESIDREPVAAIYGVNRVEHDQRFNTHSYRMGH